jgi:tripartite motif-containing protein 2/3/tripartite motif-containing protein 71
MLGQLDEPVGIAISPTTGWLYIADTWNQRVQVFEKIDEGQYVAISSWEISGWYGQSLDNKPYLTVDENDRVFVSDPESSRILIFTTEGEFIGYWGSFESGVEGFGLVSGLAIDGQGGIWITDGSKNRIQYFILPETDQ